MLKQPPQGCGRVPIAGGFQVAPGQGSRESPQGFLPFPQNAVSSEVPPTLSCSVAVSLEHRATLTILFSSCFSVPSVPSCAHTHADPMQGREGSEHRKSPQSLLLCSTCWSLLAVDSPSSAHLAALTPLTDGESF